MCCGRREDGEGVGGLSSWLSRKHSQLTCSWVRLEVVQLTLQYRPGNGERIMERASHDEGGAGVGWAAPRIRDNKDP